MMKSALPKRFLTTRDKDKNGTHRRSRSSDGQKQRPISTEAFLGIFRNKGAAKSAEEIAEEKETVATMDQVTKKMVKEGLPEATLECIRFAVESEATEGDIDKTIELVQMIQSSLDGAIVPYHQDVEMLGAENREAVTCYLDALLFAMYAKLDAFECMLKVDVTEQPERELASWIRLWVNMLRSGKLIHTDLTEKIQEALAACGWEDASYLEQQDTSEAFAFITEKLQLPLLTLQVDLFHQGKGDEGDHKKVYERLLNLAVPADPDGKGVALEDCLEDYLNTKVDIMRDGVPIEKLAQDQFVSSPSETIRAVPEEQENWDAPGSSTAVEHIEFAEVNGDQAMPLENGHTHPPVIPTRPANRARASTGVIQRILVDQDGKATETAPDPILQSPRRQGSMMVKAITIPAWQFFRFIPWGSTATAEPRTNVEVAKQFNERPVVGICLKRYTMGADGSAKRLNTYIDIPDSMRLPHFMMSNETTLDQDNPLSADYKLVLQSVVCHRGDSVQSGHYIAFARMNPKLLTDNRCHDNDPPPDYEEAQWAKFDDLEESGRVTYVDNIKEALKSEMPYLLFYQVVPMVDLTNTSTEDSIADPPSYTDSAVPVAHTQATTPSLGPTVSRPASSYFEPSVSVPSVRLSSEAETISRLSLNDEDMDYRGQMFGADTSRRGSETQQQYALRAAQATSPEAGPSPSPLVTPGEETTAQRLSRAAARFKPGGNSSRSRPTSQVVDNRIALTMSKLNFRPKNKESKEPLREEVNGAGGGDGVEAATLAVPIATEPRASFDDDGKQSKEKGKEKDKKSKSKGKNKSSSSGNGGADKHSDKVKVKDKGGVPDRECVVM